TTKVRLRASVQHAALSYCADLTSPTATSLPIGLLAVAFDSSRGRGLLFAGFLSSLGDRLEVHDHLSRAILTEIPVTVRNELLTQLRKTEDPLSLLPTIARMLRGSVFVSSLSQIETMEKSRDDLVSLFNQKLEALIADATLKKVASPNDISESPLVES